MKIKASLLLTLLSILCTYGQIEKEIENGIFITFPTEPKYQVAEQATTYIATTENCFFICLIQRNIIPNYPQYLKDKENWNKEQLKKVEDAFLDNAVKGKLNYTENSGKVDNIKVGDFSGRKLEYSAINPATGIRGKRCSIILLVRDRLVSCDVILNNEKETSLKEKDDFLNSLIKKQ